MGSPSRPSGRRMPAVLRRPGLPSTSRHVPARRHTRIHASTCTGWRRIPSRRLPAEARLRLQGGEALSSERRNDGAGWRQESVCEDFVLPVLEGVEYLAEKFADFECVWTLLQLLHDSIWSIDTPVYRLTQRS